MGDMTQEHEDPKFEQWLKDAAKSYHAPHPTPREEMWARIEAARRRKHVIELRPWMRWAVAAAAVLVLGIGIGRWSANPPAAVNGTAGTRVVTSDSASSDVAYQVAATQYLSRTETFLTGFRADLRAGRADRRFTGQARDLLTTTRLLLDSPAADDPRMRALLEDLELVLVQISQLEAGRDRRNTDLITQDMDQRNVLPKLRSAIPAGPVPVRAEGAI
jgi:hypothetical protein